MRTSVHRTITATVLAVTLVTLTGCSLLPGGEPAPSGTQSQAAKEPGTHAEPVAAPSVSPVDPDAVVLEETLDIPGRPGDTIRVGIESLTVRGDLTELRVIFTPTGSSDDGEARNVYELTGASSFDAALVDRENLKKYVQLVDENYDEMGSSIFTTTAIGGESVRWTGVFAGLEDDVATLDVRIVDSWPTFENVPVTR